MMKKKELTTAIELIENLKNLPSMTKVFVSGTNGYLYIIEDNDGNTVVSFDDNDIEEELQLRKVLITSGMCNEFMIILTDAPKKEIEKWCRHYNLEMENGENTYFDSLKKHYTVKVLADSETNNFQSEEIDIIGYSEVYDLFDYQPNNGYEAEEICPHCGYVNGFNWDGESMSMICRGCGKKILLCSMCDRKQDCSMCPY